MSLKMSFKEQLKHNVQQLESSVLDALKTAAVSRVKMQQHRGFLTEAEAWEEIAAIQADFRKMKEG